MSVVTLCDGNITNRHDITVNLSNMTVSFKNRHMCDGPITFCDGLRPQIYSHDSQVKPESPRVQSKISQGSTDHTGNIILRL